MATHWFGSKCEFSCDMHSYTHTHTHASTNIWNNRIRMRTYAMHTNDSSCSPFHKGPNECSTHSYIADCAKKDIFFAYIRQHILIWIFYFYFWFCFWLRRNRRMKNTKMKKIFLFEFLLKLWDYRRCKSFHLLFQFHIELISRLDVKRMSRDTENRTETTFAHILEYRFPPPIRYGHTARALLTKHSSYYYNGLSALLYVPCPLISFMSLLSAKAHG